MNRCILYLSWRNGICKLIGVTVSMSQGEYILRKLDGFATQDYLGCSVIAQHWQDIEAYIDTLKSRLSEKKDDI